MRRSTETCQGIISAKQPNLQDSTHPFCFALCSLHYPSQSIQCQWYSRLPYELHLLNAHPEPQSSSPQPLPFSA